MCVDRRCSESSRGPPPVPLHYNGAEDRKPLAACVLHPHQLLSFTATATAGSRVECALQYIAWKYFGVEGIKITTINKVQKKLPANSRNAFMFDQRCARPSLERLPVGAQSARQRPRNSPPWPMNFMFRPLTLYHNQTSLPEISRPKTQQRDQSQTKAINMCCAHRSTRKQVQAARVSAITTS